MPGFQYLRPLFWLGAALGFLASMALTVHFRLTPFWAWFVFSYLFGCFIGLFLRWRPDAKYATPHKIEGMGYVWVDADVVVPYFIMGLLMGVFILLRHLF